MNQGCNPGDRNRESIRRNEIDTTGAGQQNKTKTNSVICLGKVNKTQYILTYKR